MSTTKKFSQLDRIQTLDATDIFAVTDVDQTKSMKIQTDDLSNVILSDANLTSKAETIKNKLNAFQSGVGNGLQAQKLWDDGQYRDSTYFRNYNNLNGKPVIISDLSQLDNSPEYIKYDNTSESILVSGTGATNRTMTTDFLIEGNTNEYYTNDKVITQLTQNFGALFNSYSDTFDGGGVGDSLMDVSGTFLNPTTSQASTIRVSDPDNTIALSFQSGQILRLYGASATDSNISSAPTTGNLGVTVSTGFTATTGTNSKTFSYKICYYNLKTGEITPASPEVDVNIFNAEQVVFDSSSTAFNTDKFVSLSISGYAVGNDPQGVLVYRAIAPSVEYKLVAVLGDKELPSWKDYHTFDFVPWSGKNSIDNSYSSITHFPLTAPSTAQRGWTDVTISTITQNVSSFDIGLSTASFVNTTNAVQLAHNDTSLITAAISSKSTSGRRSLSLNAKTYNATHISVPDDFGLIGTANITKIKKLPWSGYNGASADNSLLRSTQPTNAQNISFVGVDFDGNILNQYLLNDDTDPSLNFLVDLGSNPTSIIIDRSRFKNQVGGGIYATSPNEFKMTASEIVNSGVTDRFTFSPLIIDNGSTTIITGNRFENFTDSIDASITSEGAIANNIIKACGSGLFVYGSTFLVSSPNVLMGAANEFLSSPDILNSEYDSINIYLEQLGDTAPYKSDVLVYQENGAALNLAYSNTTYSGSIVYRLNLVQQLNDGSTQKYGVYVGPGATGIDGNAHNTFVVGKRYVIEEPGDVTWTTHGAINSNAGTEFTYSGSVSPSGTTGFCTPSEFVGYGNGTNTPITFTDVPASDPHIDRSKGQFQFQVLGADYTKIKTGIYSPASLQSLYAANTKTSVSDTTKIHPFGSSHVGLAWSASYRYDAKVASITGSGSWATTGSYGASTSNPVYTIAITVTLSTPLSVGQFVRIADHDSFALNTPNANAELAEIVAIGVGQTTLTLKYWGAGDGATAASVDGATGAGCTRGTENTGTINIIDDFVMAQGLIK